MINCLYFSKTYYGMVFCNYTVSFGHENVSLDDSINILREAREIIKHRSLDTSSTFDFTEYFSFKRIFGKTILLKRINISDFEHKFRKATFEESLMFLEHISRLREYKNCIEELKFTNPEYFI